MKTPTIHRARRWRVALFALLVVSQAKGAVLAQGARLEYRSREVRIPMRDGVELYTQIYEPVDPPEPCPILFTRTPYSVPPLMNPVSPGQLGPSPLFGDAGYVFVRQEVRGTFRSGGEWEMLVPPRDPDDPTDTDEASDAWDSIEWLLENVEGHNGRVGMWGISYDAWQTVMAMADAHPALLAVSPQASPGDVFIGDDFHHNGAFRLSYSFAWIGFMAVRRGDAEPAAVGPVLQQDGFEFFRGAGSLADLEERFFDGGAPEWTEALEHGDYDEYWRVRDPLRQLDDVRPAVLHVAGWFDAEDFRGPIDIYRAVEQRDAADKNRLVVGPWKHGGWSVKTQSDGQTLGDHDFLEPTATWYGEVVELPFFEHHLRGGADPLLPEAFAFETGGNLWHELDAWPPAEVEMRPLYLRAGGRASFDAPAADEGHTAFESDPEWPVPYTTPGQGPVFPSPEYMVQDERFLAERDDVLTFVSEPLEEDLVIAGRPEVQLRFTTTGTDADWAVKLIDVYPEDSEEVSAADGRSLAGAHMLLCGEIFRAKYRTGFERPTPLEPGEVTELRFVLPDRMHRFRAGHRIAVQAHSTWFPLYDRNPQVFMNIYSATEEDFVPAMHEVHHREGAASRVQLPVFASE